MKQQTTQDHVLAGIEHSQRDPQAFTVVFEAYHASIWRLIARNGGRVLADDLAGEVFTVAFVQRDRFDPARGSPYAWLAGIALNLVRDSYRRRSRARRATLRIANTEPPPQHLDEAVIERDDLDETQQLVADALAELSKEDRELLVLVAWDGLSYDEVATLLGVPIGTVRSRLARIRQRIRTRTKRTSDDRGTPVDRDGERPPPQRSTRGSPPTRPADPPHPNATMASAPGADSTRPGGPQ